jgi:hypothetical protein
MKASQQQRSKLSTYWLVHLTNKISWVSAMENKKESFVKKLKPSSWLEIVVDEVLRVKKKTTSENEETSTTLVTNSKPNAIKYILHLTFRTGKRCRISKINELFFNKDNAKSALVMREKGYAECVDHHQEEPLTVSTEENKIHPDAALFKKLLFAHTTETEQQDEEEQELQQQGEKRKAVVDIEKLKEEVYTFFDQEEAKKEALQKERDTLEMEKIALKQLINQQAEELNKLKTTAKQEEELRIQKNKEIANLLKSQNHMLKYISYYEEQFQGFAFTTFEKSPTWMADMLKAFQILELLPAATTFQEFTQLQSLPSKEQVDKAIKSLQRVFHPDKISEETANATTMCQHATNLSARLNSARDFIYSCWEEINKSKNIKKKLVVLIDDYDY